MAFASAVWIAAALYLFGFYSGQKSNNQPGTFMIRLVLTIVGVLIFTVLTKMTFGMHWVFMK